MSEQEVILQKQIKITIEENEYIIKFPTIGQIIDIESFKNSFSNNQYSSLVKNNMISSNVAVDLIEMSATLTVLIPTLKEDLKVKSIFDLDPVSTKKLISVYKKEILPWYSTIIQSFREMDLLEGE